MAALDFPISPSLNQIYNAMAAAELVLVVMEMVELVDQVSSLSLILLDNQLKIPYNNQVFNILVSLGMKTLSVVGKVRWWYNERREISPFFLYKLL